MITNQKKNKQTNDMDQKKKNYECFNDLETLAIYWNFVIIIIFFYPFHFLSQKIKMATVFGSGKVFLLFYFHSKKKMCSINVFRKRSMNAL